ncbi:hypothetical protein HK100_006560, partial [Physocladia obscura]
DSTASAASSSGGGNSSPGRSDSPATPILCIYGNSTVKASTRRVAERVYLECKDLLY